MAEPKLESHGSNVGCMDENNGEARYFLVEDLVSRIRVKPNQAYLTQKKEKRMESCKLSDCSIQFSTYLQSQQGTLMVHEWIKNKLRYGKGIKLRGNFWKVAGKDRHGFDKSSIQNAEFNCVYFLNSKVAHKLLISDRCNHIIVSMRNVCSKNYGDGVGGDAGSNNDGEWVGELKTELGLPKMIGYSKELSFPGGIDWDMDGNMYICNLYTLCRVDNKSRQVSLVAGHAIYYGYRDGNNHEASFKSLSGIICQQQQNQSLLQCYVTDSSNHCIRIIDVTNGKTTTLTGKGTQSDDSDGPLQSARFKWPWDIVKDDEIDHILYVSDNGNHKIKMIDMKKGMVTTLVGDENDTSILNSPRQMQIIDSFIYAACFGFKDCIVKIDKHSKQVTKIRFNDGKSSSNGILGITYHELDQCFYISDYYNIYKLE